MWRPHLISSGVAWTHGRRLYVTRTRVSSAVAARVFDFVRSNETAVVCFFSGFILRCRAVATAVAVDRAASCGTQRASPVNANIHFDGADLLPASLSCPGV